MDTQEIIEGLRSFRNRLTGEVVQAFQERGSSFGNERFRAWRKRFTKFLDENLPGESAKLNSKLTHIGFAVLRGESDAQCFWREDGEVTVSFIDSLIIDVKSGEYEIETKSAPPPLSQKKKEKSKTVANRVFIVHGHDDLIKTKTARFVEKLGFEAIILHEQASRGKTIIEKIEAYTDVGFAIVLYTPDDRGNSEENATKGEYNLRARQNVIFEHGYLMAKLGRDHVVPLVSGTIELPSDISGVVYVTDTDWQLDIAKEMKSAGYEIDFDKIIGS